MTCGDAFDESVSTTVRGVATVGVTCGNAFDDSVFTTVRDSLGLKVATGVVSGWPGAGAADVLIGSLGFRTGVDVASPGLERACVELESIFLAVAGVTIGLLDPSSILTTTLDPAGIDSLALNWLCDESARDDGLIGDFVSLSLPLCGPLLTPCCPCW